MNGAFPHLDPHGAPIPAQETFKRMIDRISTTDPDKRMPKQSDMPTTERQELFLWLNSL